MTLNIVFAFALALITSFVVTPICRRIAPALGFVDQPNARKLHSVPMPLLGGLAIYAAAILAIGLFAGNLGGLPVWGILGGATLLAIVGLLDDRGLVHHQVKLMIAMPLAAIILILSGTHLTLFVDSFGVVLPSLLADDILSLIWIVGVTASFSIFDHMDGLCAGIAAIAAAFFVLLNLLNHQPLQALIAAGILGAALGFVVWNFNPAKLFMGDSGAMVLGFLMAVSSLSLRVTNHSVLNASLVSILVLGVPVFDTLLVIVSRTRRGLIPFSSPGKDHTAHRLANLGSGQRSAVLALYIIGMLCGLVAIVESVLPSPLNYVLVAIIALAAPGAIYLMERAPYERQHAHTNPGLNDSVSVSLGQ